MTVQRNVALQDRVEIDPADERALALLRLLKGEGYRFITPTPATHQRVLAARQPRRAASLRDIFGWSLPFERETAPPPILAALEAADLVETRDGLLHAKVRVSSLGDDLFLHSAFPPDAEDTVFFGPDTYRFASLIEDVLSGSAVDCLVEIGTGSGAGAVVAARACGPRRVIVTDLNVRALDLARINLLAAGVAAERRPGRGLEPIEEAADVIIANPPYIRDPAGRTYRDGGDMHGARLSLDWTLAGAARLRPRGRFVLYTGSAIVEGRDGLKEALTAGLDPALYDLSYREIDPDVFGEEIGAEGYQDVERIAAVGAVITRCA